MVKDKLIAAQQEYIEFLTTEIGNLEAMALNQAWYKLNPATVKKGYELRGNIAALTPPVTQIYGSTQAECADPPKIDPMDFAKYCITMSKNYDSIMLTPEKLIEFYLADKRNEDEMALENS